MAHIPEPPIHDDDTSPSIAFRPAEMDARLADVNIDHNQQETPMLQQAIGWLSLLGAVVFTIATIIVVLLPNNNDVPPDVATIPTEAVSALPTIPTDVEPVVPTEIVEDVEPVQVINDTVPPVVEASQLSTVLDEPVVSDSSLLRLQYNPFTVINTERARSEFIDYTVVQGDTIDEISTRYGIKSESIAWCNNRRVVIVLRPGDVLRIPPADGACHEVFSTRDETIAEIAQDYNVDDPFSIIDSEYNRNQLPTSVTPTDRLLGGTQLFIPGGEGPIITWDEGTQETDSSGNVIGVGFANGQAGSCGSVTPSAFVGWGNPLSNGTWVRGFYAGHSGLDLAAPTGTPIYAASSGNVMFSGFSRWGYGNAVVLEHGSVYSTLYGHMSQINVGCGQYVVVGQLIGYVGSTGDSTGPHLHFEIQVNGTAVNPSGTPGIGW